MAALAISSFAVVAADETDGTVEVTGGALTMDAAPTISWAPITLNGTDQTSLDALLNLEVTDARGTGDGWSIDITSTTFANDDTTPKTLPTTALKTSAVYTFVSDGTDATNSITHPLTVPADETAPTAVPLLNAAEDSGMGNLDVTGYLTIDIPAETYAGTYSSTITTTISTGP